MFLCFPFSWLGVEPLHTLEKPSTVNHTSAAGLLLLFWQEFPIRTPLLTQSENSDFLFLFVYEYTYSSYGWSDKATLHTFTNVCSVCVPLTWKYMLEGI